LVELNILLDFFIFYIYFFTIFRKCTADQKKLQKEPPTTVVNSGRDLPPPETVVGVLYHLLSPFQLAVATVPPPRVMWFLPPFPMAAGKASVQKIITFWYESG
jgi:hypothetical protein